ncbi:hypothetical protein GGI08_001095 [Coemansia sp. S2]|nr:hypothetical protein GGI08_001095 [Coemansia sp. S2]KAJ2431654.1 hypothetical protein GGF41_000443 [Coemansia sp. RSA 2531]
MSVDADFANVTGSTNLRLRDVIFYEEVDVLEKYGKGNSLIFYAPRFDRDDMENLSLLIKGLAISFHPAGHIYVLYESDEYKDFTLCAFQDGKNLGPLEQVLNCDTKTVIDVLNHSRISGKSAAEVMEHFKVCKDADDFIPNWD